MNLFNVAIIALLLIDSYLKVDRCYNLIKCVILYIKLKLL